MPAGGFPISLAVPVAFAMSTAVVFLTHINSRRIRRHFARLKRECGLDAFFYLHAGGKEGESLLPRRALEAEQRNLRYEQGVTDLVIVPAMLTAKGHDYVWLVEYDADFSGNWREFFDAMSTRKADFLATTICSKADSEEWFHWSWFEPPQGVTTLYRAFCPVMRWSSRLIGCYIRAIQTGQWGGHYEALVPTLALHKGFSVEDIGRDFYSNTPTDPL